jgi:hypothetical protein
LEVSRIGSLAIGSLAIGSLAAGAATTRLIAGARSLQVEEAITLWVLGALRDEPGKQFGIDVAAGEDGDRDLAGDVHLAGHQRGERHGAARLDHEL